MKCRYFNSCIMFGKTFYSSCGKWQWWKCHVLHSDKNNNIQHTPGLIKLPAWLCSLERLSREAQTSWLNSPLCWLSEHRWEAANKSVCVVAGASQSAGGRHTDRLADRQVERQTVQDTWRNTSSESGLEPGAWQTGSYLFVCCQSTILPGEVSWLAAPQVLDHLQPCDCIYSLQTEEWWWVKWEDFNTTASQTCSDLIERGWSVVELNASYLTNYMSHYMMMDVFTWTEILWF